MSELSFKRCVPQCESYITPSDSHELCVMCLGTPRGAGPAAAEAERRLHSWGSQLDLADDLGTGLSLSQSSVASSVVLEPDLEARSPVSSDPAESMLLGWSSSEEIDVTGVEADTTSQPSSSSSSSPAYGKLLEVMSRSTVPPLRAFHSSLSFTASCWGHGGILFLPVSFPLASPTTLMWMGWKTAGTQRCLRWRNPLRVISLLPRHLRGRLLPCLRSCASLHLG